MMNIFITNLGKYNEGELVGEWVELPISEEELQEVFKRIGINEEYEEYFITDYECDFYEVGEYENIETLNEIAEKMEELSEEEQKVVKAIMNDLSYDLEEATRIANDGNYRFFYDCENMSDVAYEIIKEDGLLDNVPKNIADYFDYEAYGRDLQIEGNFIFLDNDEVIEVFN